MQNTFMNKMLQRIADAVERWTGGSITIDVTGAGDMQGATASTPGVHGLVPAPAAGDENKVLTGAGTWAEVGGGGISYRTTEQDTGLTWIDGKHIYQRTFDISGVYYSADNYVQIATIPNIEVLISANCVVYEGTTGTVAPEAFQRIHIVSGGIVEIYCTVSSWQLTGGSHLTVLYTKTD